jgi:hypothetical protein
VDDAVYVGQSQALRWWPVSMVVGGCVMGLLSGPTAAITVLVPVVIVGIVFPWRFEVLDGGIALWFPFGKYRYLAKEQVTVRVGHGSTVLLPHRAERFGYPLTDGLVERRRLVLRAVLTEHGYDVTC